jgi:hypothetical protein
MVLHSMPSGASAVSGVQHRPARAGEHGPAERLVELSRQIARLSPDWTRPDRFYEIRSELAAEARRLARSLDITKG